jgi:hypothetical protein
MRFIPWVGHLTHEKMVTWGFINNPSLHPLGCVQSANHCGDIQLKQKLNLFSSKPTQKQIDVSSV